MYFVPLKKKESNSKKFVLKLICPRFLRGLCRSLTWTSSKVTNYSRQNTNAIFLMLSSIVGVQYEVWCKERCEEVTGQPYSVLAVFYTQ